ncbi:MAG: ABC transporter permease [Armatimonadetes bacterium]|nr:ABC transporter permease [Anaerolineae bacterium]
MTTQANVVRLTTEPSEQAQHSESHFSKAMRHLLHDRTTMIAFGILVIFGILAFGAPFITDNIIRFDPNDTDPMNNFAPLGTPGHLFGTDDVGRDQLARLLHAGRISLSIGVLGAAISLTIGLVIGLATGFLGGIFDDIINAIITTLDSLPTLYLLILVFALFSPTAGAFVVIIALVSWTGITRIIRGETLSKRSLDYVLSAQALGASSWRIMIVHILPNMVSIIAISLARIIGGLMLTEATLSFLGVGIQAPDATWGNMLTKAQTYVTSGYGTHLVFPPGIAITVTVLCLYIVGDGIRDAFDPNSRR